MTPYQPHMYSDDIKEEIEMEEFEMFNQEHA